MFIPSKQPIVSLCLFSYFLCVSSFSINTVISLVSWPSIPAGESQINIYDCPNFVSVPPLAASGRPDLLELFLPVNAIAKIDDNWIQNSPNIQEIRLQLNKLTSVPAFNCGAAGSEGCPELIEIWLRDNLITSLPARSFANLTKLNLLTLFNNKITTLASLWIVDCPSLKTIFLRSNANLARFLTSEDSESRGLANLEVLRLNDCNISSLDQDFLLLFPKLKDLRIYGNPMKTLPTFIASHPVKIDVASMGGFVCDCSATKLARNGMIDSTNEAGFCGSPDYNVGKNFSQLECRGIESVAESSEEMDFLLQHDAERSLSLDRGRSLLLTTTLDFDIVSLQVAGVALNFQNMQMSSMIGNNSCLVLPCLQVSSNQSSCIFSCACSVTPCRLINLSIRPSFNAAIHYIRKLLE